MVVGIWMDELDGLAEEGRMMNFVMHPQFIGHPQYVRAVGIYPVCQRSWGLIYR